jgi:capsular polysaccharide biosynthesis protein
MLDPDQLARFRSMLGQAPDRLDFEGLPCRHETLCFDLAPHVVLAETDIAPLLRSGPAHIFGVPADSTCLHGIGMRQMWLPRRQWVRLQHAAIIGHSTVLARNNQLWNPEPIQTATAASALAQGHDHYGMIVTESQPDEYRCHFIGRPDPGQIDADALFLHDPEPGNYGSFLFRQLPQMVFAQQSCHDFDCYVVPHRSGWFREALYLLGLPELPVYALREVCGERFRSVAFANEFDAEGLLCAPILDRLRAIARRCKQNSPAQLYVSRRLSTISRPWYRPLTNESGIEAQATRCGLTPVCPETWSLTRQIGVFAAATKIAGPSGSGMLNALFAEPGCKVLDLESFQVTVRQHANLYASTGKDYAFLFGSYAGGDGPPATRPWSVDPALFQAGMDWMDCNASNPE